MTPLTKFQLAVKAAAEDCDIPKVIVYGETFYEGLESTSIWSSDAVADEDFKWLRSWLNERLQPPFVLLEDKAAKHNRRELLIESLWLVGGVLECIILVLGVVALFDYALIPLWRYLSG